MLLFSCDLETHVINTVHEDGSVTRKVIMKGDKESVFDPELYRVPVDSTWNIKETFEVGENNDTTWLLTAEKWFAGVQEINRGYEADSGINSSLERSVSFEKRFRWFTTVFRFTERVESILEVEFPVSGFMSREELEYFYMPDRAWQSLLGGPDSTFYREQEERIDSVTEVWMWTGFVRQWIDLFYTRCGADPRLEISREEMMALDSLFVRQLVEDENSGEENDSDRAGMNIKSSTEEAEGEEGAEEAEDDLAGVIVPVLGRGFYEKFRSEIDSAGSELEGMFEAYIATEEYDVEIRMPGRIIASNGYAVTDVDTINAGNILWMVSSEYFLTQPYEIWVESQVSNYWAWIVTAIFLACLVTGLVAKGRKRRSHG